VPEPPVGSSAGSITVDGHPRTYRIYRPTSLPAGQQIALVIMLHGGFGSGLQAERTYGWDADADRHHFVVAYPDGLDHAWNVGDGCCGTPGRTGVDDVAFIVRLVEGIRAQLPIDDRRIFATGISNGAMLSYRLACDTRLFAAIGPDSGTQLGTCATPAPLSVIHVHGTADTRIRYLGGRGDGIANIDGPAVPEVIGGWLTTNSCPPPEASTSGSVTTSIATCPNGRAVELITIQGAGHQWPGAPARSGVQKALGMDPPSQALNATDTIWQFFATHPAPPATS
jgi:polyhydroxybutyrate depolymerase